MPGPRGERQQALDEPTDRAKRRGRVANVSRSRADEEPADRAVVRRDHAGDADPEQDESRAEDRRDPGRAHIRVGHCRAVSRMCARIRALTKRVRLDQLLVQRELAPSRERAQALILAGAVRVDGGRADRAAAPVAEDAELAVDAGPKYVSRGGDKLAGAVGKGGVVRDPEARASAVVAVANDLASRGFGVVAVTPSPIAGREGNREIFVLARKGAATLDADSLAAAAREASR